MRLDLSLSTITAILQSFFRTLHIVVEEFNGSAIKWLQGSRIAVMVVRLRSRRISFRVQSNQGFFEERRHRHAKVDRGGLDEVVCSFVTRWEWHRSILTPLGETDPSSGFLRVILEQFVEVDASL